MANKRTTKANERQAHVMAIAPRIERGGLPLKSPLHVWIVLSALPGVFNAGFAASCIVGLTTWAPALFVAVLFGALAFLSAWQTYSWIVYRGWGQVLMDVEHNKRKTEHYKK